MNEELYHYGVKGMKWGIRRSDDQLSGGRKERTKKSKNKSSLKVTPEGKKRVKRTVEKGKSRTADFLKTYGPTIAKAGTITALSVVGVPYAGLLVTGIASMATGTNISLPGIQSVSRYDHSEARIEMGDVEAAGISYADLFD